MLRSLGRLSPLNQEEHVLIQVVGGFKMSYGTYWDDFKVELRRTASMWRVAFDYSPGISRASVLIIEAVLFHVMTDIWVSVVFQPPIDAPIWHLRR